MFARTSTTLAAPTTIEAGVAHIRDQIMPQLPGQAGYLGLSLLVDHGSGRCIMTSAWQSERSMLAAERPLSAVHERAAAALGGQPEVEYWRIAVLHRDRAAPPAACMRATWVRILPEQVDHVIEVYRVALLPQIVEFEGFCQASLLVERGSGYGVSLVGFASHEAMRHTRNLAAAVRERGAREVSAEIIEVGEFELALDHLAVPELI